jgi:hypothetical protein
MKTSIESYLIGEPLTSSKIVTLIVVSLFFLKNLGPPLNHMYHLWNQTPRMQVVHLRKMIIINLQIAIAIILRTSLFPSDGFF